MSLSLRCSILGQHRQPFPGWILPISRSALLEVPPDRYIHSNPLRNGLKMLPCARVPLFFFWICCGSSVPQGQGAPASLVPGTGCWDGSEMAGGHSIRHCSPAAPQPCDVASSPGGTEGCRRDSQCLAVGWGCVIKGILQCRRETCSSRWCSAVRGVFS